MSVHDQPDLLSHVVLVRADSALDDTRPRLGREIHALFLSLIAQVDGSLAGLLHDSPALKPFAVSPLVWERPPWAWFRFAMYAPTVGEAYLEALLRGHLREIRLGKIVFTVERVFQHPSEHPWARTSTYETLWRKHMCSPTRPDDRIRLEFLTPTTFRAEQRTTPLPQPDLVFGSLLAKWNAFSPRPLNGAVTAYASAGLSVTRYALETEMLDLGRNRRQVGFCGVCEFAGAKGHEEDLRAIRMLADYSFFAGVGYKATMGMGMVMPVWSRNGKNR